MNLNISKSYYTSLAEIHIPPAPPAKTPLPPSSATIRLLLHTASLFSTMLLNRSKPYGAAAQQHTQHNIAQIIITAMDRFVWFVLLIVMSHLVTEFTRVTSGNARSTLHHNPVTANDIGK
uniref:Uncharacterized protein n=1 Tax=Glossina austeni TaxID=7395 RepID=A0A1A9UWG0_GLOAU